jgi:hypothetical protein
MTWSSGWRLISASRAVSRSKGASFSAYLIGFMLLFSFSVYVHLCVCIHLPRVPVWLSIVLFSVSTDIENLITRSVGDQPPGSNWLLQSVELLACP